jgi:Tfp pilus assembly PilM family ATPase
MSKYLALEWDEHEVRLAIAHQRGGAAVLERAFAVPLPLTGEGQSQDAASVAGAIREAIAGDSVRKIETLAVVGRPSIELKELSLPPAPDDELPDLVRFQALRDFTHLADDTPLDYLPLPVEGEEHRNVLAAAISADLLKEIRATCSQAGLELHHLVLRPCAAASLLCRHRPAPTQIRMFVDLLGDEVDLTVLDRDSPILMRTTRLPGDASQPEYTRPVFLEIRRTIASVQNKLHGRRVEAIALCGDGPSQQMLADLIRTELDLPTEHFDPFTAFELAGGMKKHMPERHSRFAPLLGMLADAAAGQRHGIDFLSPRRRPAPKTRRREAAIAVAVLGVLLVVFSLWTWYRVWSLDSEIARLGSKHTELDKYLKKNKDVPKEAAALDAWTDTNIPWLDVLYRVSSQAPKSEDVMLTALVASTGLTTGKRSEAGADLRLEGLVGDSKDRKALEDKLRSGLNAKMNIGNFEKDVKGTKYAYKFKADIKITREAVEAAREAAKKAAKAAAANGKEKEGKKESAKTEAGKTPPATETKASAPTAADAKATPSPEAEKKETPLSSEIKSAPVEADAKAAAPAAAVKSESSPAVVPSAAPAGDSAPAPASAPTPTTTSPPTTLETKDG